MYRPTIHAMPRHQAFTAMCGVLIDGRNATGHYAPLRPELSPGKPYCLDCLTLTGEATDGALAMLRSG